MKVVSGIMIAAMATLAVNLIGSKDVHANAVGDLDRGGDMFDEGVFLFGDGGYDLFGTADFNQDGLDDVIARSFSSNETWLYLNDKTGKFVKVWQLPCGDEVVIPLLYNGAAF